MGRKRQLEPSLSKTVLSKILRETEAAGFRMASERMYWIAFVAPSLTSKPKGALLELGTGTGVGTLMAPFRNGRFLNA